MDVIAECQYRLTTTVYGDGAGVLGHPLLEEITVKKPDKKTDVDVAVENCVLYLCDKGGMATEKGKTLANNSMCMRICILEVHNF